MSTLHPGGWGLTTRLVMIAVIPATFMFLILSTVIYLSGNEEMRIDTEERAVLLGATLSESVQYGLISGNTGSIRRTLEGMLAADRRIARLEVRDSAGMLVGHAGTALPNGEWAHFETPIVLRRVEIDMFDGESAPHVSSADSGAPVVSAQRIGQVSVTMTLEPVHAAKHWRLATWTAIALVASIASGLLGLWLAQWLRRPLHRALGALRDIQQGRYDVALPPQDPGELGEIQDAITAMARELKIRRQALEEQVQERTLALQAAVARIRDADDEKRRLIAHNITSLEEERRSIALELHDGMNGWLIPARLLASALATRSASLDDGETQRIAQQISDVINEMYTSARNIVKQLRPETLDSLGLIGAIDEMVRGFDRIHPGCHFEFVVAPSIPSLGGPAEIAAYRMTQEALSNVVKHARARNARVSLAQDASGALTLCIADDGVGLEPMARHGHGLGLIGMQERIHALGGRMTLDSGPAGTTVTLTFQAGTSPSLEPN